jgi:hypothetical protein
MPCLRRSNTTGRPTPNSSQRQPRLSNRKARAAIAACEGGFANALSAADRANQAVSFLMLDRGLAKGIREDLLELIAGVQAELRKEASARQARLSRF